jgi:hypothetical protein
VTTTIGRAGRVVVALLAALAFGAQSAGAATYGVQTCDNGSTDGWTFSNAQAYSEGGDACRSYNPPNLYASIINTSYAASRWTWTAPADTEIGGFSIDRRYQLSPAQAYGTDVWQLATDAGAYNSYAPNMSAMGVDSTAWEGGSGMSGQHSITAQVFCGGGGACTGNAYFWLYAGYFTLRDNYAPQITSASGSLLAGGVMRGAATLSYGATDRGGGLYRALLTVDGTVVANHVIDANGGDCATVGGYFRVRVPCKLSTSDSISLDTRALPDGTHSVQLFVRDATDSNQATYGPFSIDVDNVPPPVNTSVPLISGIARHGQTLVADDGTWTGTGITFARQWQRYAAGAWQDIAGATSSAYAVQAADYGKPLRFRSRATNGEGATDAYSQPTDPIASPTDPNGDLDGDGTPNASDPDADGDGVPNPGDANPMDPHVGAPDGNGANGSGTDADKGAGSGSGSASAGTPLTRTDNGLGATATASLAATFQGTDRRTITVKWGAKRRVIGTLTQPGGAPIVGAKLDVTSTAALMGATPIWLGQVATDSKGRFLYALPSGVSRTIRFGYKNVVEATSYAQTTDVVVRVIPRVTMRADHKSLRNKHAVTFAGKIAGAPAGARKIVVLQALDGRRWRTFASTRVAGKGGTFKYRYRFERTTRPTAYQFRAIVPSEQGWPFMTGQSKPTTVKVRP